MATERDLQAQSRRGDEAARLYGNPLTQEMFAITRAAIEAKMKSETEPKAMIALVREYQALDRVEFAFKASIANGEVAKSKLAQMADAIKGKITHWRA